MRHGDHLLALGEVEPAWELTPELDTIGPWTAGTDRPLDLGAHNRAHPVTGDLFALAYDPMSPTVTIHHIDPAGRLQRSFPVALAAPSMIHDFVLTERHLVLLIGPAVFDMAAARAGRALPAVAPRPRHPHRRRSPSTAATPRWIETDACFVFHFANGFERGGDIVIDYVRHEALNLGYGGGPRTPPRLHRLVIDPAAGTSPTRALFDGVVEFPRIDDRRVARPSRYVYVPTLTDSLQLPNPAVRHLQLPAESRHRDRRDRPPRLRQPHRRRGGLHPARRSRGRRLARDLPLRSRRRTSDLALLDAARLEDGPVAVIRLPQRVPQGLHGAWIPKAELAPA